MQISYTVTSTLSFAAAAQSIQEAAVGGGFRVLHVHDIQATFAEKGITREPYCIIEVCNVKYANQALTADPLVGLMMPCKINVWTDKGETRVSLLLPSLLAAFFPEAGLSAMAQEIESKLRRVVDSTNH